jgi:hypothetical protein
MNGVGYSSVTRSLRLAQIMKSMELFKDEKIGGRNAKEINVVSGVSRTDIEDALKRTKENANNIGNVRYIDNVVLASLDPEKPVSVATISLASLPDGLSHVAYIYQNNIITFQHLPIGLLNLNSQEARNWFFTTQPTNVWDSPEYSLYPAKPYGFMQRIINELMKNCPSQWGP